MDEKGIIKYQCLHQFAELEPNAELLKLIKFRNAAFNKAYIGVYSNGIGYGNISARHGRGFCISGSATGHVQKADHHHFSLVTDWDIKQNKLYCEGPVKASSESLTHAAIYQAKPETKAILHIHDSILWKKYYNNLLSVSPEIEYGTTQMAIAVAEITRTKNRGILIMQGHQDGLIGFGKSLEEVFNLFEKL